MQRIEDEGSQCKKSIVVQVMDERRDLRVDVGGQRKRAAVVLSGGFSVKQWKALCVEVNKGG